MQLPIQYTNAPDGTRIAYSVTGSGPPIVWLHASPTSNIRLSQAMPRVPEFFERFAQGRTLIQIDFRNSGMSQRGVQDKTQNAILTDLLAVLDAGRIDRPLCLGATATRSTIAVRLAARYPERVERMILIPQFHLPGGTPGLRELARQNWPLWLEMHVHRYGGDRSTAEVSQLVDYMSHCINPEDGDAEIAAADYWLDFELAPQVKCPVLVLLRERILNSDMVAPFAALLPNAILQPVARGLAPPPLGTQPEQLLEIGREFFGEPEPSISVQLSPRECEVLGLIAAAMSNDEIARQLAISERTVERHASNIYGKIGVRNRAEAVAWAMKHQPD